MAALEVAAAAKAASFFLELSSLGILDFDDDEDLLVTSFLSLDELFLSFLPSLPSRWLFKLDSLELSFVE